MGEKRVHKKGGILIIVFVILIATGGIIWWCFSKHQNNIIQNNNEEYVSVMSDKSDYELEEMFLKDFLQDMESRDFKYQETNDKKSEQYGFNLVFNIVHGNDDYCRLDEYRKHDLTSAYCELKYPTVVEDDSVPTGE